MKQKPTIVAEWGGGIGDLFYGIWNNGAAYAHFDLLKEDEYAVVVNRIRNPSVTELLLWHPNRDRIVFMDLSWYPRESFSPEERKAFYLPSQVGAPLEKEPVFYPSNEDKGIIAGVTADRHPFIVFALAGSFDKKNVPIEIAENAADVLIERGYTVIQVGKNYLKRSPCEGYTHFSPRTEDRLRSRSGVISLIDKLSLPGTCELVRASKGTFCCDSGVMHLSMKMKKPTFVALPDEWGKYWRTVAIGCWGKSLPFCRDVLASEYESGRIVEWVNACVGTPV
jgi:hypothetical protein